MKYSKRFLVYLRSRLDILVVIKEELGDVQFRKSGKDFISLCPFHKEKTPSFRVSVFKQIFHCFGCGIEGDVFSFVMFIKGFSFKETVKYLVKKYKIGGC